MPMAVRRLCVATSRLLGHWAYFAPLRSANLRSYLRPSLASGQQTSGVRQFSSTSCWPKRRNEGVAGARPDQRDPPDEARSDGSGAVQGLSHGESWASSFLLFSMLCVTIWAIEPSDSVWSICSDGHVGMLRARESKQ